MASWSAWRPDSHSSCEGSRSGLEQLVDHVDEGLQVCPPFVRDRRRRRCSSLAQEEECDGHDDRHHGGTTRRNVRPVVRLSGASGTRPAAFIVLIGSGFSWARFTVRMRAVAVAATQPIAAAANGSDNR